MPSGITDKSIICDPIIDRWQKINNSWIKKYIFFADNQTQIYKLQLPVGVWWSPILWCEDCSSHLDAEKYPNIREISKYPTWKKNGGYRGTISGKAKINIDLKYRTILVLSGFVILNGSRNNNFKISIDVLNLISFLSIFLWENPNKAVNIWHVWRLEFWSKCVYCGLKQGLRLRAVG